MSSPVHASIEGGVATLTIDGAISQPWADAFVAATADLAGRGDAIRVVVLRSDGRHFCPGGDLHGMPDAAAVHRLAATLHEGLLTLTSLDAPVIARVHAVAAGAGLSLVLACDLAVAARSASLTMAYSNVGLTPDGGASWMLPRLVGLRRATELVLTSRRIGAEEAAALGLVTEVVDDEDLDSAVSALVDRFRSGPTAAHGVAKRLLRASATATFEQQLAREAEAIAAAAASPTGQEGIAAFLAKRPPSFP